MKENDYRKLIVDLIEKINSTKNLRRIYKLASYLYIHEAVSFLVLFFLAMF